jgi:hypothetical protein
MLTLSLFRQGLLWYERIPNMHDEHLALLMQHVSYLVANHPVFACMAEVE